VASRVLGVGHGVGLYVGVGVGEFCIFTLFARGAGFGLKLDRSLVTLSEVVAVFIGFLSSSSRTSAFNNKALFGKLGADFFVDLAFGFQKAFPGILKRIPSPHGFIGDIFHSVFLPRLEVG
jgi:hypothetical protein